MSPTPTTSHCSIGSTLSRCDLRLGSGNHRSRPLSVRKAPVIAVVHSVSLGFLLGAAFPEHGLLTIWLAVSVIPVPAPCREPPQNARAVLLRLPSLQEAPLLRSRHHWDGARRRSAPASASCSHPAWRNSSRDR